jgi:hypothetical protein
MKLKATVRTYPALSYYTAFGSLVAIVIKALSHWATLTPSQGAFIATVLTGLAALITMFQTHDATISALVGFSTTVMTGLATFGLHLSTGAIAVVVAVITFVAGTILHMRVSPS